MNRPRALVIGGLLSGLFAANLLPTMGLHGVISIAGCKQEEHRVIAMFANGVCAEADLLVGADGMRSTLRRQFMPEIAPRYVGYVAWRGVVEESQIPPHWRASTLHDMVFCLPDGELAFSIPMAVHDDVGRVR